MKRIKNVVAAFAALVLGISLAFADKAQYDKLLAEGKAYEEKCQWVHAMGAYWDAMGSNLGDAEEAQEGFERIYNVFGEYGYVGHDIPNPGPGEYDDFSRYDGWIELCKDFEIYWNEHPGEIFTTNLECSKGDVDMKSRTASYNFKLVADFSEKYSRLGNRICYVFREAYKKYRSDWPDIPAQWPAVSIFKDSKTIPVVKFISAPCEFHTTSNKETYLDLDPYTIAKSYRNGEYGNSISFYDKKTTEAYVAAWNNFCAIVPYGELALWEDKVTDPYKNMAIKISIKDENGRIIASMSKPDPLGDLSGPRGGPDGFRGKFSSAFTISGISASDIKVLDSGKWTYSIDSFVLTPREATAKAENSGGGFNQGTKLTNVKYKTVSPTIDYLKGNAGFASVDVLEKNKEVTAKNKASNLKDALPQIVLNGKGEIWLHQYADSDGGYKMKYVLPKEYRIDYNDFIWCGENKEDSISVEALGKQVSELAGTDYKYRCAKDGKFFIYRALNDDEFFQLKKQLVQENDLDRATSWKASRNLSEKEEALAKGVYKYLKAKEYVAQGKLHTTLNELEIADKKGALTIKNLPSSFIEKGLQKKDVITRITVTDFLGNKKTIQASELKTVLAPATCVFTVQRGSGKKAQTLDVTIPVEWNIKEERDCDLDRY
ncbi:MAG: hypothetical protein J6N81_03485 [Treponema sp.]|nr:hypothetical protein [Treponema sp.]